MLPSDPERPARNLARLARAGRATAGAAFDTSRTTREACPRCGGRGCYVERAGRRRRFSADDFDPARGDRYEATCPACAGAGTIEVSEERARANERRALKRARREYARLREEGRVLARCGRAAFDALVRRRLRGEGAGAWIAAARALLDFLRAGG